MLVRIYCHIGARTGYGVAARALCRSLLSAGVDIEIRSLEPQVPLEVVDYDHIALSPYLRTIADLTDPDIVIVHTLPLDCTKVISHAYGNEGIHETCPAVAYTTWECHSIAPLGLREDLGCFDQVWTPSSWSATRLATGWDLETERPILVGQNSLGESPVLVVPHAYDADRAYPCEIAEASPPYRFLYVGAWTARKNPAGLIRAFAYANLEPDEAELWIHSPGTPRELFAVAHAETGCHDRVRVRLLDEYLSPTLLSMQYATTDCFVTATRGEAWNLPAFEAMLHRRHIIAPSPSGSSEFLGEVCPYTSANLIPEGIEQPAHVDVRARMAQKSLKGSGELELMVVGAQGVTSRATWWDPDLVLLGQAMREACYHKRRDLRVDYNPADRFSYAAVGKLALKHLEEL